MDMPRPTEAHQQLERLAGTWVGEETMHASEWDPKGGIATGYNENRMGLDGFALICNYRQEREGHVTFRGHGVYTYDPERKLYQLHWFDSMGSPPECFEGNFEGDRLELSHGGPGMHARMSYDLSVPGQQTGVMHMSKDGKEWMRLFDGVYRRS